MEMFILKELSTALLPKETDTIFRNESQLLKYMKVIKFSFPSEFWILFNVHHKPIDREKDTVFLHVYGGIQKKGEEGLEKLHCEEGFWDRNHLAYKHLVKTASACLSMESLVYS